MSFIAEPITDGSLDEAIAFLQSANPFSQHAWGWDTGRFIDWRWGGNILRDRARPGFFARHGTIIRRAGDVAGLVISEVGADDHCILTATEDRTLVGWALTRLEEQHGGERLILYPADDAVWVHEVLAGRGFVRGEVAGLEWGYDLATVDGGMAPPDGFIIDSLAGEADYPGIDACLEGAFGGERDRVSILRSLATNPLFRPELNIVARTPASRIAAYCRGTVDPRSGVGGIDPVATHPDFQGRGLGKAIVRACFAAQARLGGTRSYIGSGPEGSAGSRLYRSLDPISKTAYSTWSNRVDAS